MPTAELLGTDQDGNKIEDYCVYCYENGAFKQPNITLQEMADICTGYMVEEGMDENVARKLLAEATATSETLERSCSCVSS